MATAMESAFAALLMALCRSSPLAVLQFKSDVRLPPKTLTFALDRGKEKQHPLPARRPLIRRKHIGVLESPTPLASPLA